MRKTTCFTKYVDPGHGWLKVKLSLLEKLGIKDKITPYSYLRGDSAYLEEDSDIGTFLKAYFNGNIPQNVEEYIKVTYKYSNKSSKIRSYNTYPFYRES